MWTRRAFLVVGSLALTSVALEGGYRLRLAAGLDARRASFAAASESNYVFDRELGYRYIPGSTASVVRVQGERVVARWSKVVNADGNVGDPAIEAGWSEASHRILVVGDSITANPNYGGVAWPDYLHASLHETIGGVAVANRGRDGYGILQMATMARAELDGSEPHLLIIAFITDDLTRGRFWRTSVEEGPHLRLFNVSEPREVPGPDVRFDLNLIEPRVAGLTNGDDASFLTRRYVELTGGERRKLRRALNRPWHVLLLNRLRSGNAFTGLENPARNPRHHVDDFADDPRCAADLEAVRSRGVTTMLVHLPTHPDLVAGRYRISRRQSRLLSNLRALLPAATYVPLLDHMGEPDEGWDRLFHLPLDDHPNQEGARILGEAVAGTLMEMGSGLEG